MDSNRLCNCRCHRVGTQMRHFSACCNRTYEKYLNQDGSLIGVNPVKVKIKVEGPVMSGKTTIAQAICKMLIDQGIKATAPDPEMSDEALLKMQFEAPDVISKRLSDKDLEVEIEIVTIQTRREYV